MIHVPLVDAMVFDLEIIWVDVVVTVGVGLMSVVIGVEVDAKVRVTNEVDVEVVEAMYAGDVLPNFVVQISVLVVSAYTQGNARNIAIQARRNQDIMMMMLSEDQCFLELWSLCSWESKNHECSDRSQGTFFL